jgi:hypothetical protein
VLAEEIVNKSCFYSKITSRVRQQNSTFLLWLTFFLESQFDIRVLPRLQPETHQLCRPLRMIPAVKKGQLKKRVIV